MKIQRTIPPAAAPLRATDFYHGLLGFIRGRTYIRKLTEELKEYFGVRHVFTVSSGKAALTIILKALRSCSPEKNLVIIPAYTCFSVPSAIVKAGLQPALCDIDPSTFDYNHTLLKETINNDVLCVVSTHLFGIPADVEKIKSLCRPRGIFIVEDAAQAMGGQIDGKMLGTIGDVGLFSLGRGKNITCGSGGIIVTNSDAIAAAITAQYNDLDNPHVVENLKDYFSALLTAIFVHPVLYWFPAGLPFLKLGQTTYSEDFPVKKLSGMKAGLLRNWKDLLEQCNNSRKMTAAMFQELCKVDQRGKGSIPYLRLPILCDNQNEKDKMYSVSQEAGLGMSLMYPTPINEIKELRGRFEGRTFPFAKLVSKRLLTIPTHPLMKIEDRERLKNILFKMGQYC